ncbi:hypothetical protein GOP47_0023020 [Adiantum capillus-veneris]|uniref:Cytochrome P450 n=1 Tax=Adiantum capillus-veneris TaxID=13818 RepID=A0A9D4U6J5_ADICA|nr:hypothetical protein GOP47_0023020 [Adiantum capillus-veneris]
MSSFSDLRQLLLVLGIPFFIFLASLLTFIRGRHHHHLPPGPPGIPILGNLLQLGPLPHRFLANLHKTYGPLVYLRLGSVHTVTTNDSEIFKEMMSTQDHIFASRYQRIAIKYFCYNGMDLVMGPYGDAWKRLRRIGVEHLLSNRQTLSFQRHRREEADCMVRFVMEKSLKGELVPLRDGYNRRCQKALERMEEVVNPVLEDHRARRKGNPDVEPSNFIDLLLSLQEKQGEDVLSDVMIKALILDLLGAGTDTTAVTNEWAMVQLLRHPHVMCKLQEELDNVVGKERALDEADLRNLPYLRCVTMEVLRLSQPGPFVAPRECLKATKVARYEIPANTMVIFNLFAHGRNPKVWPERTEEFVPERHMQNVQGKGFRMENGPGPEFHYTAFGGGRRRCAGASLAMIIVMLAVGRLLQSFNWAPPAGMSKDDIDLTEVFGLSTPLAAPLFAVATPRLSIDP